MICPECHCDCDEDLACACTMCDLLICQRCNTRYKGTCSGCRLEMRFVADDDYEEDE